MVHILRPIISRGPSCMASVFVWCVSRGHVSIVMTHAGSEDRLTRPRLVGNTCDTFRTVRPAIIAPDVFVKVRRPPSPVRYGVE